MSPKGSWCIWHLRAYMRAYLRVGKACLETSEVIVAGNEWSLGSIRNLSRWVAENERRGTRTPGSGLGQRLSRRSVSSLKGFYHVHVAMKVKLALEQPPGTGVGHELASAVCSCTCYSKLTHKGHVYVYDKSLRRWTKHPNTRSDDLVWVLCFILCRIIYTHAEHMPWLIPLQHHSTPLLPVMYFGVEWLSTKLEWPNCNATITDVLHYILMITSSSLLYSQRLAPQCLYIVTS